MNAHGYGIDSDCVCGRNFSTVRGLREHLTKSRGHEVEPVWLTEHDVARVLGLSVKTMSNWRNRDQGPPYVKLNRAVRYRRTDLDAWIESRTVRP
jgi:predicted DNA-binding transcriptional regulator AlpA